mgnify:CR=1 FL=1
MKINHHPLSVYTRGWDCQISKQDTDKQTSKITRKITKFLDLGAQKHRQRNIARLLHFRLSLRRLRRLSAAQRRSAISAAEQRQSVSRNASSLTTEGGNSSRRTANSSYGSSTKTEVDWQKTWDNALSYDYIEIGNGHIFNANY